LTPITKRALLAVILLALAWAACWGQQPDWQKNYRLPPVEKVDGFVAGWLAALPEGEYVWMPNASKSNGTFTVRRDPLKAGEFEPFSPPFYIHIKAPQGCRFNHPGAICQRLVDALASEFDSKRCETQFFAEIVDGDTLRLSYLLPLRLCRLFCLRLPFAFLR
jgi:hypothetical protein